MEDSQALRIVSALANGTNPLTGEVFPADSPYQVPDTIRALYVAARALEGRLQSLPPATRPTIHASARPHGGSDNESTAQQRPRSNGNAGKPWSPDEDHQLLASFDAGKSLTEIAQAHARTQGGVRARLEKHGRLEPSPATRWPVAKSN